MPPRDQPTSADRLIAIVVVAAWVVTAAVSVLVILAHVRQPAAAAARGTTAHRHGAGHRHGAPASRFAKVTITITDVGDMNFGTSGRFPPGGAAPLFAGVARELHSNLTVGNLETALGSSGVTKCGQEESDCFTFQAPASYAAAVHRAGFGAVNVANNHTDDAGPAGVQETDEALRDARLRWTGRPGQITYLRRHGIRIALLGFAPYSYDSNLLDIRAAVRAVRRAAAHARLVIVFMHAGAEGPPAQHVRPGMETYLGEKRGDPVAFARAMVRAGADLVLGSGPHVLRAMQWYRGRLIAYSLGNFVGYYTLGLHGVTADSAILRVRLRADGTFVSGRLTPIRLVGSGTPELDPTHAGIRLIDALSRADMGAGAVRISPRGRIRAPHTRPVP